MADDDASALLARSLAVVADSPILADAVDLEGELARLLDADNIPSMPVFEDDAAAVLRQFEVRENGIESGPADSSQSPFPTAGIPRIHVPLQDDQPPLPPPASPHPTDLPGTKRKAEATPSDDADITPRQKDKNTEHAVVDTGAWHLGRFRPRSGTGNVHSSCFA